MKYIVILILFSNAAISARLTLNNAGSVGITSSTIINDSSVQSTFTTSRECCVNGGCSQYTGVALNNPTNKQLKIALDGYEYEVNSEVQLIHSVNLLSIASTPLRSCMKASGGFPSVGTGQTNLSASNVYLGLSSVYLDVANWRLMMRSIDNNLVCDNGTLLPPDTPGGDVIFYDGFDVSLIFKNGFEQ